MECVFIMKVHHGGLVHARTSANACKMQQKPFPSPLPFLSSKSIGHSDFEFTLPPPPFFPSFPLNQLIGLDTLILSLPSC